MAVVNCYISLTISQDSSTNPSSTTAQSASPIPRQTKILLPKKKPLKWSTGVGPGEWGGPPTTSKLRKYWGGQDEDPLTADDFIWNKDFMGSMKRLIDDADSSSDPFVSPAKVSFLFTYSIGHFMNWACANFCLLISFFCACL